MLCLNRNLPVLNCCCLLGTMLSKNPSLVLCQPFCSRTPSSPVSFHEFELKLKFFIAEKKTISILKCFMLSSLRAASGKTFSCEVNSGDSDERI